MTTQVYPWQTGLWQSVCRLAEQGRLPHALLLAAPAGMGKERFARTFAAWRLCQQPQATGACGLCRSCQLIAAGTHPDFLWVTPEVDGDKISKVIKIEQARAVVDFANQSAQMQGYRVVVLAPADALNTASANALLKTLEEPGRDSVFLLLTDSPMALLATIRSRCQLLPLTVPDTEVALAWLRQQVPDAIEAATLMQLARGAPVAAARLHDSPWFQSRADLVRDLCDVRSGRLMALQGATRWHKLDPIEQVTAWQSLLDDAVQLRLAPEQSGRHTDITKEMQELVGELSAQTLLDTLWQAVECRRLLDTNVQPQAILENLWLYWARESRKRGRHGS